MQYFWNNYYHIVHSYLSASPFGVSVSQRKVTSRRKFDCGRKLCCRIERSKFVKNIMSLCHFSQGIYTLVILFYFFFTFPFSFLEYNILRVFSGPDTLHVHYKSSVFYSSQIHQKIFVVNTSVLQVIKLRFQRCGIMSLQLEKE